MPISSIPKCPYCGLKYTYFDDPSLEKEGEYELLCSPIYGCACSYNVRAYSNIHKNIMYVTSKLEDVREDRI